MPCTPFATSTGSIWPASSRSGTTIGGCDTIRYWPSCTAASFESAWMLSRMRALSATFSAFLRTVPDPSWSRMSSTLRCEYHTSSVRMSANAAIDVR